MTNSPHSERETGGLCERAWEILTSIPAINDLGSQFQEDITDAIITALSESEASSTIRAQAAELERLRGALEELQDLFAREGENSIERFDRLAEMFDRDTGYMAPGKSRPMHRCDQPDGPELHRIYDEWFAGKIAKARRALSLPSNRGTRDA